MSGSWEIIQHNANSVLVAILTRETVTTAWAGGFRNLQIPGLFTFLSGMPFDHARNSAVQKLLELGWDWLFFLDDDVICPPDTIPRLVAHRQAICSGLYYRRNEPICPVMLRNAPGGRQWITEYPANALIEVDLVGAGCLLLHRSVFATLPGPHWFDWRVDRWDFSSEQRLSEDFAFCEEAKKKGFKIVVDTSIQCKHCGLSETSKDGMKPLVAAS